VALRLGHGASERAAIAAVDRVLERYGSTGAHGRDEQVSHRALSQEIGEQKVFGIVLPSVFLGVAVFLLNVVLTRQIGTQRGQIAALKALGRPDREIGWHYLKFVLVIVSLGIVIGVAAGAWLGRTLTAMYSEYFRFPALDYGCCLGYRSRPRPRPSRPRRRCTACAAAGGAAAARGGDATGEPAHFPPNARRAAGRGSSVLARGAHDRP